MKKSIIILFASAFYLIACGDATNEHNHDQHEHEHNEHDGHDHGGHEQEDFVVDENGIETKEHHEAHDHDHDHGDHDH